VIQQLKTVAAVVVHGTLPPFARAGQTIDVTGASLGNAKRLRGGSLLLSPLKGADGQVYAMAQGSVAVSGLGVSGADGSKISVNIPSAGLIPGGATVEREVASPFADGGPLTLQLNHADFTTANRIAQAINKTLGAGTAASRDAAAIDVRAPQDPQQRVAFVSIVENIAVEPAEAPARVVINTRTGTVVMGGEVRVSPAAVSHGSLTVTIAERADVSQPAPFSDGRTVVTPRSEIEVSEEKKPMFLFGPTVTLAQVVEAVNRVGAGPSDLVAILEALREAGALHAELVVI
jgi:flagellar P-ring protein precursor FlgI